MASAGRGARGGAGRDLRPAPPGPFSRRVALLDRGRPVVIQTHDYPDLDAVASAWALAELLGTQGISALCRYRGPIRSRSLARMIAELGIPLAPPQEPEDDAALIVVDGSPTNGNVGIEDDQHLVGVIDHHCSTTAPCAPFLDLRPELAACSTIICGYWAEARREPPREVATALLAGIQSDTDFLSRRASPVDFEAYATLFRLGDFPRASRIVRTVLDLPELGLAVQALGAAEARDGLLWALLPGPCGQEVLAVIAEFVLRVEELRAAVVAEKGEGGVHLSVRSKDPSLSAFAMIKDALAGLGSSGGHSHSAGGFIPDATYPGEAALRERFFAFIRDHIPR